MSTPLDEILQSGAMAPADCLLAAAQAGWFVAEQPAAGTDALAIKRYLQQHLAPRSYRIRLAEAADLPALLTLEAQCWPAPLRTAEDVLAQRVARYPQGQLVLLVEDAVVGVIYSQLIGAVAALEGIAATQIDNLHDPAGTVVQLLAVNVLPQMQQHNLGDQLLEFMLTYRSLQAQVQTVAAITLCKHFDAAAGIDMDDYIRVRNQHGTLADPILRFHELHGAVIERVMPGYRPADLKNLGNGVLVSYDIHRRTRRTLQLDPAAAVVGSADRAAILQHVQQLMQSCLPAAQRSTLACDRPLMEMGLDSADLLMLNETLAQHYRLALNPTFFFRCNTIDKIADYLCSRSDLSSTPDMPATHATAHGKDAVVPHATTDQHAATLRPQDIAIIGMACRLPGAIDTPQAFWQSLLAGTSLVGKLPAERWQWPQDIDPAQRHQGIDRGAFLQDVAAFDAPFFRISPAEAESMDPQQRLLLELSWQAIEHAGYAPAALSGSATGVFIGASGADYARLLERSELPLDAHYGTGSSMAVLANRLSYYYDFNGPSLLIDTACSSSLVALHQAVQSLQRGEVAQALVGGVNLILHPANSIAYYKAGMLARDGLCKTFDDSANGYVRSEGALMFLLKPAAAALADGDCIHAIIKGSASNHGGQSGGLTVPNPAQQARLLQAAWNAAGIDPLALGYIEAHGTGTALGDPLEVQGLAQAFATTAGVATTPQPCSLGSVKTNLGHLEAAAGLAGLLKTVLCLQHGRIPANLHFQQLNRHIELAGTHLQVVTQLQDWPAPDSGAPRLAGVSSFGSGGANAHAVLAEYLPAAVAADHAAPERTTSSCLFVLSARTRPQLLAYARNYLAWLQQDESAAISLAALAHQLQRGRQAMAERLAWVVDSRAGLVQKLRAFCASQTQPAVTADAQSRPPLATDEAAREEIRLLTSQGDLERLASLWQAGASIDWSLLPASALKPARIVAPTYPFARHRYWLPHAPVVPAPPAAAAALPVPLMLVPLWRAVAAEAGGAGAEITPVTDGVLFAGDLSEPALAALAGAVLEQLQHIVWIAPAALDLDLAAQQEHGLLALFRLVKTLLAQGYGERALRWTVVTRGTQAVFAGAALAPAHAGVHGLTGVLAKEYPRWSICALDLEPATTLTAAGMAALMRMQIPAQARGDVLAQRNGQWFRRVLAPVTALPPAPPAYRQRGVYVVIGGAGGIGAAWTRHVMSEYDAQVVWIGRRAPDAALSAQLQALAGIGTVPLYVQADATDAASLQRARDQIRQSYPVIHGVIHCAVGQFDHSLAEMDEQRFRDIVAVKIDASVNLAQVFGTQALDFLLYFSSIVALEKNGGHSGYAAGGAFEDAYAMQLAQQSPFPVKVINWGHWDAGTGLRIADAAKTRLQQSGRLPLSPAQALAALQQLLGTPLVQTAVLNTSRADLLPLYDGGQELRVYPPTLPPAQTLTLAPSDAGELAQLQSHSLFGNPAMEAALLPLLAGTLAALDADASVRPEHAPAFYAKWLAASRELVQQAQQQGVLPVELAAPEVLWQDWEGARRAGFGSADMNAACALAEACLRAVPAILSGTVRATDVLFPDASMRMVEGIYRANAVADYFNRILAESVVALIEARLRQDPTARLRLLEIGAGTGGTTALLLPYLAPYREHIEQYAYTDLSKAFLFHAETHFVPDYPFVVPLRFDVEQPLAGQAIAPASYDLVIATNVLHATQDIRRTLANAKAALHKDGCLLLNEISDRSVFAHLTFGLLEGWWLSQDQPLRMQDAPGLYPQAWREVLTQEGFRQIALPAQQAHVLGQQVIVAVSDGVVRQQTAVAPVAPAVVAAPSLPQPVRQSPAPVTVTVADDAALKAAASAHLKKVIATCLRMDSQQIDVREPLASYGLDSILIVQITNALRVDFPEVAATLLFECHTVDALAQHLLQRHQAALRATVGMAPVAANPAAAMAAVAAPAATTATAALADHDAIAVIGMSCRFPQARNSEEYWRLLAAGGNAVGEVPGERWDMQGFFHGEPDEAVAQGKSYSKWGGFLDNVTEFDPLFFNISPKEALSMDPQERLFLQTAWETLEDAGYTRDRVAGDFGQQLGVFAGITRTGFDLFGPQLWQQGSTLYPHTSFSSVANRVSYFLNARGPSVPVDTMCSSSLTAIHQASQSLRSGECRLAIAGGVNLYLHPSGYVGLSASRMLSRDGVCRSFGRGGNGFVPGEGVGAVLLKPLAQAQADNDRIYAVIRATHVNHGGKTNGYTVPNPQAQGELVSAALRKAGVSARAVSYIEAHGTGTELGDPIEVAGLVQAFREHTDDVGFCALGSAKSNIGHLEAAAGIAGLIKVILQLQHGQLVPTLHATEVNPNIDFARTPFVLQQSLAPWQRPLLPGSAHAGSRIAGVSSFGAGGANAHVVLEEYPVPAIPAHSHDQADGQDCLIVLSARNAERLQAYAERLHAFVGQVTAADAALPVPALADLAYTLQVGREQMEARLALVARTWPQLREQLCNWLNRQAQDPAALQEEAGIFHGQARQYRDMIAAFAGDDAILPTLQNWFRQGQHGRLLNLWSKGLSIDWELLYPAGHARRRVAAPTYPFAATPYWLPLDDIAAAPVNATAIPAAAVPPPVPSPAPVFLQPPPILAATSEPVPAKPSAIRLLAPAALPAIFHPVSTARMQHHLRPLLSASAPIPAVAVPVSQLVPKLGLYDEGDGVVALRLLKVDEHDMMFDEMAAASALSAALAYLQNWPSPVAPRVLLLSGLDQLFGAHCRNAEAAVAAISVCKVPVVAVLSGCNGVAAMTVAAACELVVCSSEGRYSDSAAGTLLDGSGLRGAGYTWPLVAPDQLEHYARDAAERIAQAGTPALVALKAHLAAGFAVTTENAVLPPLPENGDAPDDEYWEPVALASSVVTLKRNRRGVVLVSLCERSSKNTFSPAFVEGVIAAFEHISSVPDYKVVVLTGYDHYFACGGTRAGLLAIQSGRARFTDEQSYRMPLSCDIPVIAAMQGHAIGAGWTMGLFCDWAVYSEESTYQSPYMLYGFTPGAGSTLIFPQRLGRALSHEILLTARPFLGRELQQRLIGMPVLPRSAVLPYALALAEQLAQSDRNQLIAQKSARSAALRQLLPQVFAQELALHDRTFVNNPDVIANIARHFTEAAAEMPAALPTAASTSESGGPALLESLRASLIEELQLQREQFDDDATFIDLGLDSISAVTWVRKINRQFSLTLGATRVYSYPTLRQFAAFVQTQLPQPMAAPATVPVSAPAAAQSRLRSEELLAWLRIALARELQLEPQALDDDMKFIDLGLDSITAVTWVRGINRHYGLEIGATKVYSYPCLTEFHRYVLELLETAPADAAEAVAPIIAAQADDTPHAAVLVATFALAGADATMPAATTPVSASTISIPPVVPESVAGPAPAAVAALAAAPDATDPARHGIAIIGMSGQFPKADNVAQFWRNIMDGRDCVSEIPATRWPLEQFYDPDRNAEGKTVCRSMGLLETRDEFDPLFFNISPSEAEYMDPQQRLFLQNSWRCIEDAGYDPGALSGSLCGVFVGCAAGDYSQLMTAPEQTHSAQGLMGESVAILPARIAYFLNLQGPCLAIDTACSSSLVALASACDSLVLGHSEVALAGGVYVINGPDIHVKMSKAGMLSPDGRCYSFDQRANGFVPGEGVGVLMLKRLDHATRDGDDIYGVIRGWGVNQDGKTNGITAPNAQSQTRLEASIYRRFDINPEHIGLIEAHGTGTKLGDPIEVDALCSTFRQFTARKQFCALGSVKSNIGHLANAAGVTGVIKAVLALQHRSLPPTINYRSLNEHIALQDSPFFVNAERREWLAEAGQPRLVAVSSFGFSGTNGHMVLAEAEQDMHHIAGAAGPLVLPLAARNRQQLQAYAQVLSDYLAADEVAAGTLDDLMHTFQFGRAAMAHRLVVIAATREQLQARLARYALDGLDDDACISGVVLKKAIAPAAPVPEQLPAAAELAARWVSGVAVDWRLLYPAGVPGRRRHGMPTYPFARERYWIPAPEPVLPVAPVPTPESTATAAPTIAPAVWSAPAPAFDAAAWRIDALASGIDWSGRLCHWQQRRLLVLHADSSRQQAFSGLLTALQQAAGKAPFVPCYADLQQLTATPLPARPGVVLVLAGGSNMEAEAGQVLAACRHIFSAQAAGSAPDLVLSLQSSAAGALRLAEELAAMAAPAHLRCLLLSQDQQSANAGVVMQRLCQEWLSWDGAGLQQVHYAGAQRLVPAAATPRTPVPAMYLIERQWQLQEPVPQTVPAVRGEVLVLVNHESLPLARKLLQAGDFSRIVLVADASVQPNQIQNAIDFSDAKSARMSAQLLTDQYDAITHVIDLSDLYDTPREHDADKLGKMVFYQALAGTANDLTILYCTKGLQAWQSPQMSLAGAKFAGLVKMLSADYRHIDARCIDIDQQACDQPQELRRILLQECAAQLQQTELCYRQGQRYAPMLALHESTPAAASVPALTIDPQGVYVISGGTNGVGLELAKYLTRSGCRKLVLMGATPLPPRSQWEHALNDADSGLSPYLRNKLPELMALDRQLDVLEIHTGSLSDEADLQRYFRLIRNRDGDIRGVIHCAGRYSDADTPAFAAKDPEHMQQVLEPKIKGLENLHAVLHHDALDFFVALSSMTGVLPHLARGAGDYATANAFVDFFMAYQHEQQQYRQGRQRPCLYRSIVWSDWNQTGAITRISPEKAAVVGQTFEALGMRTFSNREGQALFALAMQAQTGSRACVAYVDQARFGSVCSRLLDAHLQTAPAALAKTPQRSAVPNLPVPAFLHHLDRWEAEKRAGLEMSVQKLTEVIKLEQIRHLDAALIHRIHKLLFAGGSQLPAAQTGQTLPPAAASLPGQGDELAQLISHTVMEVLKLKSIDATASFQDYGLDSISAMVLATRLEKRLQQQVQPQWLIDYATVTALTGYLAGQRSRTP